MQRPAAGTNSSSAGLSYLSQELMADSSLDQNVFATPEKNGLGEEPTDTELLLGGGDITASQRQTTSDSTKKDGNLEDVNLLDAF